MLVNQSRFYLLGMRERCGETDISTKSMSEDTRIKYMSIRDIDMTSC